MANTRRVWKSVEYGVSKELDTAYWGFLGTAATAQNTNNATIRSILLPTGPAPDPETADPDTIDKYYETVNLEQEVACLMLSSMSPDLQRTLEKYNAYDMLKELKTMFEEQTKQELFETVKAFHACKQEEGQSVSSYLLKMKSYLDTLERLGYVMPNKLGVSLILNSLNKDYDQFVQNYNMHSMGKTIAELHAMLKLHEKGIPKKAETPVVLAIREGKIQKDKKKPRGAKGKDKGKNKLAYAPKPKIPPPPRRDNLAKDSVCHHCKEGLRESRKLKHGALSLYMGNRMRATVEAIGSFDLIFPSSLIVVLDNYNVYYFNAIPRDGLYEIDMHNLYPNVSSMFNVSNKRAKHTLDSSYLWHCHLGHINKKRMDKLQRDRILQPTHDESLKKCNSCISGKMALAFSTSKKDTQPSKNTSKEHNEVAPIEVEPQNIKVPIRRSARIPQAPNRYGFYVDVEEYELGDLHEPPNYKAALSNPEFDKWLEAINTEMQSMKDNLVWVLVDLPPNCRTVGSKWIFKKKTNMDGNVHTFKVCLIAKGYTQTYSVDYGKTFSPVADTRAIRILLAIVVFHDYEIWQMDVKTTFLNGHLSEATENSKKKGYTPMIEKPEYRKSQGAKTPSEVQRMQRVPYASAIGLIMYAVRCTRPDVVFTQNLCSRFQQNLIEIHWTAVKTILKYLRNTKDMVLVYGAKPKADLKKSAKKSTNAMSSTKAKYIAAAEASMEVVWMRKFINRLGGVVPLNKRPMEKLCDNEPTIAIANDLGILMGDRHFQSKYHYIHEVIQECEIVLKKVHTYDNVADPFTKPMPYDKHYEHVMAIGIVPARSLM
ncbi:zinc finger, CCHC-type containing protein [Tanacetum coccineum]